MASPVNDVYNGASGSTIYGGRSPTLPAWVPTAGKFSDISQNTLYSIKPSGWPNNDVAGPFLNWAGGFYNPYWGTLGAVVIRGSGHLSPGSPFWSGNWVFDLDTLQWVGRNVPAAPLVEDTTQYNGFFESTNSATLGHTPPPHTYDGLVLRSPANGGSAKGSMWTLFSPGSPGFPNFVHEFDLTSATSPPVRQFDDLTLSGAVNNYPMSAVDDARGGFWLLPNNGTAPMKFVKFDKNVTTYTSVGYGSYGDNSLIYFPAPYDCLVGFGRGDSGNTVFVVYVCPIVGGVPQGFTQVFPTGTAPADGRCGGVWVGASEWKDGQGKMVCYESNMSLNVHTLTPPAPNQLTTGTWTWNHETLVGDHGQAPSNAGINPNSGLPYTDNGIWSRFVYCPPARCFLYCNSVLGPMQAWRLSGTK